MQQHPLVASPATARHATRGDHQISRGNPDTGAGDKKKKKKLTKTLRLIGKSIAEMS